MNLRGKQDKICLWTKNAANEAAQVNVGKQFKDFLEYDQKIGFLSHVRLSSQPCCCARSAHSATCGC